jgi:hypothetical protein
LSQEDALAPDRGGARWDENDYRKLAQGLRDGLDDATLSLALGRTRGGLQSRARMLLRPLGNPSGTVDELRDLVAGDPGFDLLALARDAHELEGTRFWCDADDARLRAAFDAGEPDLKALADELSVPEGHVVDRMTRIRIARSTLEAVDRLGADPAGSVAMRAALARDKAAAMLWVLSVVDRAREHVHVSLHPTEEAADQALAELQPGPEDETDHRERWFYVIAERLVGEGSVRSERDGSFSPKVKTP